ncbi:MAG: general secretion pathway protein GspK [Bdellovibrionota bacterium]|jgi:type II secretory pathway component PulK
MTHRNQQKGENAVVLLLVIMFLAFATILVTSLAHSTFLQAESIGVIKNRLKAEYILKSLTNYAASLIQVGKNTNSQDIINTEAWEPFKDGLEIPPEFLGFFGVDPNEGARIALQITPITGSFPIHRVENNTTVSNTITKLREVCLRLFTILDLGAIEEKNPSGLCGNKVFTPEEMLGNLIDYLDIDKTSFSDTINGVIVKGCEDTLPEGSEFKNDYASIIEREELSNIPGFTPQRLRLLVPFITTRGSGKIDVNIAPKEILMALDDKIDEDTAERIIEERNSRENGKFNDINEFFNLTEVAKEQQNELKSIITTNSTSNNTYEVIARVAYPNQASYFMQATITRYGNNPPRITTPVIY